MRSGGNNDNVIIEPSINLMRGDIGMGTTKQERIAIFQDTQERMISNIQLKDLTDDAVKNTVLYYEGYSTANKPEYKECPVSVTSEKSFDAAETLAKKHRIVAVLNFASATNPGGGVATGASAQEEYLCRLSNLYPCLAKEELYNDFYRYHRTRGNSLYSDRVIYSKRVIVFKKGAHEQYMDDWFRVDVITSPAPNLRDGGNIDYTELKKLHQQRITNILETACDNGAEALVLGAYGCGAFKNPPKIVAGAFKTVLLENGYKTHFKEILFAIMKSRSGYCPNLAAFEEAFA
jgi:uncharacterized protein (TIGR02452 family)